MKFRSKFEETVYETAIRNKRKLEYEPSSSHLNYVLHCRYVPDFLLPNGIVVETKGRLTQADRRKMVAVRDTNPRMDIRFVFQRAANTLSRRSKVKYWEWSEKHGFKWAEGTIPLAWWKEKRITNDET